MNKQIFKTNRIIVDHLNINDLFDFYAMQSDCDVMKHVKEVLTYDEAKSELERFIGYYNNPDKFYNIWAVRNKESGKFMGIAGIYKNKINEYEVAVRLTKVFWNDGFGSEILEGLITYCFDTLELQKLVAHIYPDNIGSIKMTQKFMTFEDDVAIKNKSEKKFILNRSDYHEYQ